MSNSMDISGIPVNFPFQPYPCQVAFMRKTIEALTAASNALLESPTGTGKTLCLLCSSLAWQKQMKNTFEQQTSSSTGLMSDFRPSGGSVSRAGIIIYASRTHSQLKQVIGELRSTGYYPKVTVLGSREQLCVHEKVSKSKGSALNHLCNATCARHACIYKNNLDTYNGAAEGAGLAQSPIQDIEDLIAVGKKDRICPYFYTRDNSQTADLVLVPYNYLLDASIRSTLKVEWENAVIIIDEAHNLEQVASDASSFTITSTEIAQCIGELQSVLRILQADEAGGALKSEKVAPGSVSRPSSQSVVNILKSVFDIEKRLGDVPLTRGNSGINGDSSVHPGGWLLAMFEVCGFSVSSAYRTIEDLRRCADLLLEEANRSIGSLSSSVAPSEPKIMTLSKYLSRIFRAKTRDECLAAAIDYKVYICDEDVMGKDKDKYRQPHVSATTFTKKKRVLNYWCFSPGLAMQELKKLGVRSIIMTSGTLSPMDAFREDMKLPFPVQLENPHVIEKNQIFVGVVGTGPYGKQLNSSFKFRDSSEYKDELGSSIYTICQVMSSDRNSHFPSGLDCKGGILVFFPSYGLMESAVERWKQTGIFEKLHTVGGGIIVEPKSGGVVVDKDTKRKEKFGEVKKPSFGKSTNPSTTANTPIDEDSEKVLGGIVSEMERTLASRRRCIMLAVCRGKISEGIDFTDSKGRVVIITGIPYAPHMEPWVVLKRAFLDEQRKTETLVPMHGTMVATRKPGLSGQAWYNQAASRAVNQAIGRVIRHKNDWGAIFLLDDRFLLDQQVAQLSSWVKPNVIKFSDNLGQQPKSNSFISALHEFHRFVSSSMSNRALNQRERPEKAPAPRVFHRSLISYEEESSFDEEVAHGKEVVISADSIKETDSSTFVDPSLLQTQMDSPAVLRAASAPILSSTTNSDPPDLGAIIGSMKQNVLKQTSVIKTFVKSSNFSEKYDTISSSLPHEEKKKCDPQIPNPIVKSSSFSDKYTIRSDDNDQKQLQQAASIPAAFKSKGLTQDKLEMAFDLDSIDVYNDSSQPSHQESERKPNSNQIEFEVMKVFVAELKEKMARPSYKDFKTVILKAQMSELKQISQVTDFIGKMIETLSGLDVLVVKEAIKTLSPLVPKKFRDVYLSTAEKIMRNQPISANINTHIPPFLGAQKRKLDSASNSARNCISRKMQESEAKQDLYIDDAVETITLSQDQCQASSKRALMLLQLSGKVKADAPVNEAKPKPLHERVRQAVFAPPKATRPSATLVHQLEKIENFELTNRLSPIEIGGIGMNNAKKSCIICRGPSKDPYAARCGHICCFECWQQWFKVRKACVLCRTEVAPNSIVKIIIV